jgi:hypothetical protein
LLIYFSLSLKKKKEGIGGSDIHDGAKAYPPIPPPIDRDKVGKGRANAPQGMGKCATKLLSASNKVARQERKLRATGFVSPWASYLLRRHGAPPAATTDPHPLEIIMTHPLSGLLFSVLFPPAAQAAERLVRALASGDTGR